jgi:DNA polymerase elongation subunit (family B)
VIPTKSDFNNKNIKILSIDFETRQQVTKRNSIRNQIFAAGFYSNTGFNESIHLEDNRFSGDEIRFIRYIIYKIQSFQGIITGWYLANSDLIVLDEVCNRIGVTSPVGFYEAPISQLAEDYDIDNDDPASPQNDVVSSSYPYLKDKKIIDMYKVFHHGFIKNSVYPLKYRDLQLDTVATGMLGYGKYVSESTGIKITGENITRFPLIEQKKYVLIDAELVIKLIERNNYEIFNILRCIAQISGLDFKLVCHAGIGKAWESIIYRMIQAGECSRPLATDRLKKKKYSGGFVLQPEPKSYIIPIEIFDVKGLYPTVMTLHNLSFETVCCSCCGNNPASMVPQEIMDSINEGLQQKIKSKEAYQLERRSEGYWICLKKQRSYSNNAC